MMGKIAERCAGEKRQIVQRGNHVAVYIVMSTNNSTRAADYDALFGFGRGNACTVYLRGAACKTGWWLR